MPIRIADNLPARQTLEQERIFVMEENRALTQDIRALRLVILNLMPNTTAEKAKQYAALMKSVKNNVIRQADTDAIVQRLMGQAADASSDKAKLYSDLIKAFSSPRKSGNTFDAVEAQMAQAKKDAEPYDTYQWLASTVFTKVENGVDEEGNTLIVRNSNYADFRADPLPEGTVDIVGLLSFYATRDNAAGTWQFYLRDINDVIGGGGKGT